MKDPDRPGAAVDFPAWLTPWSLAALIAGFALGTVGNATGYGPISAAARILDPMGSAWMTALRFSVVPLVVLQVMAPILRAEPESGLSTLLLRAAGLFAAMLVAGGALSALISSGVVSLYSPSPETVEAIRGSVDPDLISRVRAGPAESGRSSRTVLDFVIAALSGRHILALMVGAIGLSVLARLAGSGVREATYGVVATLLRYVLHLVLWVLYATPLGIFVVILSMALEAGLGAAEVGIVLILMWSGVVVLFTLLLYPFTALLSDCSIREFADGVAPGQLVGAGTRSSVASLPALMESADGMLRLPDRITGMVLPLSVAVFKMSEPVHHPLRLLFLASVFGVSLGVLDVAEFLAVAILTSVSVVGMPSGGGTMRTLPAYLSAGIPIEGVLLTEALETIPDVFMTVINVTGYMSAAVVLAGWDKAREAVGNGR